MSQHDEVDTTIDALYAAWFDAFQRGDVNAVIELLAPDYLLWAPGMPAIGREALRPRLAATFTAYEIVPTFEREERMVSGDLAFERGWDVQELRPRVGGEKQTHRQRVFLVLRREADGTWRFARGMSQLGPPR
jgi:uncharacterized protein (TIGR02246 family)